jgi:hypothetical protein
MLVDASTTTASTPFLKLALAYRGNCPGPEASAKVGPRLGIRPLSAQVLGLRQ